MVLESGREHLDQSQSYWIVKQAQGAVVLSLFLLVLEMGSFVYIDRLFSNLLCISFKISCELNMKFKAQALLLQLFKTSQQTYLHDAG